VAADGADKRRSARIGGTVNTKSIRLEYDEAADAACLKLKRSLVVESEEVLPGLIVDFDDSEQIVGVEILRVTSRFRARHRTGKRRRASTKHAAG